MSNLNQTTTASPFELAAEEILLPADLQQAQLEQIMAALTSRQVDYADIFFQSSRMESWVLEDGIIKEGSFNIEKGSGLRAVSGEKTGFAYVDEIALPGLLDAANTAGAIARAGQNKKAAIKTRQTDSKILYAPIDPLPTLDENAKIQLLHDLDAEARKQDARVSQVFASLVAVNDTIMVFNSEGNLASDVRPLIRVNVSVIVEHEGRREQGSAGGGARMALGYLLDEDRAKGFAREAVRQALVNLDAIATPAGSMPVVLGPGWPGILLHEAVGHGLEGDFNRKGTSAFSGRVGEQVASSLCTIVDDGTLADRRGSLSIDDEGTPSQNTVLIENGILKGYMQDTLNARLMKTATTGNGRRESYAHLPMPRMTNTYMLPGESDPDEIIASVNKGLYAVNFGGGQVDITSGKFVFSASEAYLIENGKITSPVKGATLIGNGPDAMTRVSMVGNNLQLDTGVGTCGKEGQSVPVGVGQPTLKIDNLTVGGTDA